MTCRHCRSLLSPYLDEQLDTDERQEVQSHLTQCASCSEYLHQLTHNQQLVRALPATDVTSRMSLRLQARLQAHSSTSQSFQPLVWWHNFPLLSYGTLATCAASVLFYFALLQGPPAVSAEEVVSSMDELIGTLDPDEGERAIAEETPDEEIADWPNGTDQDLFENENERE